MEFSLALFYKIGMFCFIGIGIMGSFELYGSYPYMTPYGIIRSFLSILFNSALAYSFYWLLGQQPKVSEEPMGEDIDEIIKKLNKELKKK